MEIATEIFGDHTRKVYGNIPPEGLRMRIGQRSESTLVPKEVIGENLSRFFTNDAGIRELPSGDVREAAIEDTIELTRKLKLQASLRFLSGSNPNGELSTCSFNQQTGEVGNFDGGLGTFDYIRSLVVGRDKVEREKAMDRYDLGQVELQMDSRGQIVGVTFMIEAGNGDEMLRKGLKRGQIMLMTAVAENNKKKAGSNTFFRPNPELKIGGVRQDGTFARSETFWEVFDEH